jgi:AcrR family transcriptional regulator
MSPRPVADPILDAARATVLDLGLRRATVSEVARRASVSRMTVYRRYPDGAALIRALMTREFGAVLDEAGVAAADAPTARERLVRSVVRTVEVLREHPLLGRLLDLDPELLLPYLVTRPGRFQLQAREAGAELVAEGQADGSIRAGDRAEIAATVEVAARGFVFGADPPPVDQLERLLDAYLRPVGEGGRPASRGGRPPS